jgi:DNA-binding LacI/PurR family transcriptional regulator
MTDSPEYVKKVLTQRILEGRFKENDRFYSDRQIEREFGLSRTTASKIVSNLVFEKLLYRKPRSGTYVLATSRKIKSKLTCLAFYDRVYGLGHPFIAEIIRGVHNVFDHNKHLLQLCEVDDHRISLSENHILHSLLDTRMVDGLFITVPIAAETLENFQRCNFKLISLGSVLKAPNMPSINFDFQGGYRKAIDWCVNQGRKKIGAILVGHPETSYHQPIKLLNIIRSRLEKRGLTHNPSWFLACNEYLVKEAVEKVQQMLAEVNELPDVLFVADDDMAMGVIAALREQNIKVPEQISVIGSGGFIPFSNLTTIKNPLAKMGEMAADIMIRLIEGEEINDSFILPSELIIRST